MIELVFCIVCFSSWMFQDILYVNLMGGKISAHPYLGSVCRKLCI